MKKYLSIFVLVLISLSALAQDGGIRGTVVSRVGREALSNVNVTLDGTGLTAVTDREGNFIFESLPQGTYTVLFETPEFEELELRVRVATNMRDLRSVVVSPSITAYDNSDQVFVEFDMDSPVSDEPSMPPQLAASRDLFGNITSYRFSEMRFNARGYDSPYQDIYLNGIRFNDAMTGYGPWSLWSGLNDATRNQQNTPGLIMNDFGIGGIGGMTNVNARASQMRKGFRVSVANTNQMYRLRAIVSYASGQLDNGWSYAFSASTRQGGNGWVEGIYYNSYAYFASVEKSFASGHRLALTVLASPTERGAQQASTDEAYRLFESNYYNPNMGLWAGDLRNSRVRNTHEPIAMLNYIWDISENTRLNAGASVRFGRNAYSALTWNRGADPRADYYRYLPSYYTNYITPVTSEKGITSQLIRAYEAASNFTGYIDYDQRYRWNSTFTDETQQWAGDGQTRSNAILEDRRTDQMDYNFAANISHNINKQMRIIGGVNLRKNVTSYFDVVKDLMGGDYWYDIDKFADRDMSRDPIKAQNDLDYYEANGHARVAREGDKFNYNYKAHLMEGSGWLSFNYNVGGFSMTLGGKAGYTSMHREGVWRKGLFPDNSQGNSEKLNYFVYSGKGNFSYKFSRAHRVELGVAYMENAPKFNSAFVSPRTRNTVTQNLTTEKIYGADLTYNLVLPFMKARVTGFYTEFADQSKVISFYDDTFHSFTNFAMSGIDKRHYGLEAAVSIPLWKGISLQSALSWGEYTYTSNPDFVQTVDNIQRIVLVDQVNWKGSFVESTPQFALNVGLDYYGGNGWFAGVNFNYYRNMYLSMNPMYRTKNAIQPYINILGNSAATDTQKKEAAIGLQNLTRQERLNDGGDYEWVMLPDGRQVKSYKEGNSGAYTLSANVGKNWYIGKYMLGVSVEVRNIINNQDIKTGGYEQMRLNSTRRAEYFHPTNNAAARVYSRFDSKYFYMLGTNYYLNVYLRF